MCPPGVDQTTRSPQQWHFIAPRMRQRIVLDRDSGWEDDVSCDVIHGHDKSWSAWFLLAKPKINAVAEEITPPSTPPSTWKRTCSGTMKKARVGSSSILERMPPELLDMVFGSLDKTDIIALGLASQSHWIRVRRHVYNTQLRHAGSWAGAEIAFVGNYLTTLPPSFEKDDLAKNSVTVPFMEDQAFHIGTGTSRRGFRNRMVPARRFNYATWQEYIPAPCVLEHSWHRTLASIQFGNDKDSNSNTIEEMKIPSSYWQRLEREISFASLYDTCVPVEGKRWALRNLDTYELVWLVPGKHFTGLVDHPGVQGLQVDDVLLLRTIWTQHWDYLPWEERDKDSWWQRPQEWPTRQNWAGHRFEIVAIDLDREYDPTEWKDVTLDVVQEAHKVYRIMQPDLQLHSGQEKLSTRGAEFLASLWQTEPDFSGMEASQVEV